MRVTESSVCGCLFPFLVGRGPIPAGCHRYGCSTLNGFFPRIDKPSFSFLQTST